MDNELKKCTFCGNKNNLIVITVNRDMNFAITEFVVDCPVCGCCGPLATSEADAKKLWNTRPFEDALIDERDEIINQVGILSDENATLRKQLEELHDNHRSLFYELSHTLEKCNALRKQLKLDEEAKNE